MSIFSGDVLAALHTSTQALMCIGFGLLSLLKVAHSLAIASYRAGSKEYAQVSAWRAAGTGRWRGQAAAICDTAAVGCGFERGDGRSR